MGWLRLGLLCGYDVIKQTTPLQETMRIVCPSCHAAYDVPDQVVARRRKLRCARCGADFNVAGSKPAVQPRPAPAQTSDVPRVLAAEPRPAAIVDPATVPAPDKPAARAIVLAGWVASFALLGVMGWSAVNWRVPIMQVWPAATRVYAALGYVK